MIAETLLGRGDMAFKYYQQINPASKNEMIDIYECEPYSYPQNILGNEHRQFGLGRNSWLSGTASWTYQAATKHIVGVSPCYSGLQINPCIPKDWNELSVTRVFRGATYHISIKNPYGVHQGVKSLRVDGKQIEGNIIPLIHDHQIHRVEVILE